MNEWQPINTAPRDGTVIEIKCSHGIAPWYGLFKWTTERKAWGPNNSVYYYIDSKPAWVNIGKVGAYVENGPCLTWRPYIGTMENYVDPTRGAQDGMNYWRQAYSAKWLTFVPKKEEDAKIDWPSAVVASVAIIACGVVMLAFLGTFR
jgi:hypothetical protein